MRIISFNFLKLSWFCILVIASVQLGAQEICDNAIDDDNDGLIDLLDDECACSDLMASSLIPNPSFEDMTCCPFNEAELECAVGWIQASAPTTDYVHTCGILGNPFLGFEAPLPFPDGEGAIGFRDGKPGFENFKEYAGSCLTQEMTVGTEYRLDFFVGFHNSPGSLTFDMAIFGSTECSNLPFGGNDENFGCPTNGPGWVQLGAMTVNGENEWKNVIFDFVADQSYSAIVLGPACAINPNADLDPYFFFDRLVLAESIMFEVPLADISGNICEDDLVLTSSDGMGGTYQWYQDGVALLNETNQSLNLTNTADAEGIYEVVVTTATGCFNGQAYELEIPSYESVVEENFCEGGSIIIAGQEFDQAGTYDLQLTASDGCDSLVTLVLETTDIMTGSLSFEGCEGEILTVNNEDYSVSGNFTQNLTSVDGCDSILSIQYLVFDATSSDLSFEICANEVVDVNGEIYSTGGQFTQQLSNVNGCDSILSISITSAPAVSESISFDLCESDEIVVNGQAYNQAGSYSQNLTSAAGCDSILNINILEQAGPIGQAQYSICEGSEIVLNGQSYNQEGDYTQVLATTAGCDSTLNINIAFLENSSSQLQYSICDDDVLTVNGETFSGAGSYSQTLIGSNGCDSVITIQIFSQTVCSDCIFFEEFTSGTFILSKLENQNYSLGLFRNDELKISVEISHDQFTQFGALYLVDNEMQLQGKKSKVQELIDGQMEIEDILDECHWNKSMKFSLGEVVKALPYNSAELTDDINNKKLDLLYGNLLDQCEGLPVGGQMKINFR